MTDKYNHTLNKFKIDYNRDRSMSRTSHNFVKREDTFKKFVGKKDENYSKYISREDLLTRYNNETRTKILKGNRSLAEKIKDYNKSYEVTIQNTHEEKRNTEQFKKLYEKLKKETEDYLKKKEGKSYEDLAFADLITYYKKLGYKIPNFNSKNKNLFDPSPLLLPNEKISDYYLFVEKLNDLVDTKLKKNFYKDFNLLHELTNQINSKISGQDKHKIINLEIENNMVRLNRIRKAGTRIEMRNIKDHIKRMKTSYVDLNKFENEDVDTLNEEKDYVNNEKFFTDKNQKNLSTDHNNYINTAIKYKSNKNQADVVYPLPLQNNPKNLNLNFKNNNHVAFNISGNDFNKEAQSTYFDTKSTFNHSRTINTQPFTLHSKERIPTQMKKIKFNSSKMTPGLNLFSLQQNGNYQINPNNPATYKKLETLNKRFSRMSILNNFEMNTKNITNLDTESSRTVVRKTKNEILKELYNKIDKDGDHVSEIKNYFQNYSERNIDAERDVTPHDLVKNFNEIKSKISFLDFHQIFKKILNNNGELQLNTDALNKLKEYDDKILNSQIEFVKELNKKKN